MKTIIDISNYQEPEKIDYNKLADSVDGVIIRSSYGTGVEWKGWGNSPDPSFDTHYQEFTARGVPVGAYHYIVEFETVDAQLAIVKRALDGKNLPLGIWADVELENGAEPLTRKTVIEFITKIEAVYGEVGVYTSAYYWNAIMGYDNPYSSRKLWVAHYGVTNPYIPIGWNEYFIHQYTSSGRLPGYASSLDMNRITDENWQGWVGEQPPSAIEPLAINPLSQKDVRWANEQLGTSPVTIGGYGCLLTCAAMVCNYFGKNTNPSKLNQDLITVGGYESGNLLKWGAIETIYPDIKVDWHYFLADPEDALIDEVLVQELPVFVQVDYNTNTSVLEQHWVLVVGKEGTEYLIVDPIDGSTAYLSRYAGKAWRMAVYYQQEVEEVLFKAKCIVGALNVRSGPSTAFDKVDLLYQGDVVNVYEEQSNWFRIEVDKWCSGYSQYMEKIEDEPEPPILTLEERVERLEKVVFG